MDDRTYWVAGTFDRNLPSPAERSDQEQDHPNSKSPVLWILATKTRNTTSKVRLAFVLSCFRGQVGGFGKRGHCPKAFPETGLPFRDGQRPAAASVPKIRGPVEEEVERPVVDHALGRDVGQSRMRDGDLRVSPFLRGVCVAVE